MIKIVAEITHLSEIDTVNKNSYLMDKDWSELRAIAKNLGINTHKMAKPDVVYAISEFYEDQGLTEQEVDLTDFTFFEVRYVGDLGVIRYNAQSLASNNEYDFFQAQWKEVVEMDYDHFYRKIDRSIEANQVPHWQARRTNRITGAIKNAFAPLINKIWSRPPSNLRDVKHVTAEGFEILKQLNIGSISELLALPKSIVKEKLYLNDGEIEDMFSDARRSFKE